MVGAKGIKEAQFEAANGHVTEDELEGMLQGRIHLRTHGHSTSF